MPLLLSNYGLNRAFKEKNKSNYGLNLIKTHLLSTSLFDDKYNKLDCNLFKKKFLNIISIHDEVHR